jgi:hypothetical protein
VASRAASKSYTAAPPDVLRVDEKHLREHSVFNCCGVIITSNHKADGIYLPPDDRRHFVAWSDLAKEEFAPTYWNGLWEWYARGGYGHVAAYLADLDLSSFDPKAPPPKTPAFWDIVDPNRAPEDAELADMLDEMGNPEATTLIRITFSAHARNERLAWLKAETGETGPCRILTNARCLSEGVDVPALDAILFLHPRKSQIDVVQSVGRVMRRAEGKKMGYGDHAAKQIERIGRLAHCFVGVAVGVIDYTAGGVGFDALAFQRREGAHDFHGLQR